MDILTLAEFAARPQPSADYLIDSLIPEEGRVALIGPPKEGKSFLALQVALAVAAGEPFFGRRAKQAPVVYFQFDTPIPLWWKRVHDIQRQGVEIGLPVYMAIPATDKDARFLRRFNLLSRDHFDWAKQIIERVKPGLIIIDVLRKIHRLKENNSDEMLQVLQTINELVAHRATLILHHSFKLDQHRREHTRPSPSDAGRGSSFVAGEVDASWLLWQKQLDIDSRFEEEASYKLSWDEQTGLLIPDGMADLADLQAKLLNLCHEHPQLTHHQLAPIAKARFGVKQTRFYREIGQLACRHKLVAEPEVSPATGVSATCTPADSAPISVPTR